MTARVMGTLSTLFASRVMEILLDQVVPFLNNVDNTGAREGAIEAVYCILTKTPAISLKYTLHKLSVNLFASSP